MEKVIIKPLMEMCRPGFAAGVPSRKKRFIKRVFRGVVNAGRSILGIFFPRRDPAIDQLSSSVNQLSIDMFSLKKRIENGEKRQDEFDKKLKQFEEEMAKLDNRLFKTEVDIATLQTWKTDLIQTLGTTMTLVTKLGAYFKLSESHMNEIVREWKDNRLSLKLFDIFMLGNNHTLTNMHKNVKPVECYIDPETGTAKFQFLKNDTDFGVHVLEANPFTLYEKIPGSYLGYRLDYVGPSQVAYDEGSDCIVPYSGTPTEIIMFPGEKSCLPMNELSVYKYWKKSCFPMYYMDETSIQFKAIGENYYIYCYGFRIKVYKSIIECPNYVFKIHTDEVIEILNNKSVSKVLKPEDFQPAKEFHSKKVVMHLMPKILQLNFYLLNVSVNCPYPEEVEMIGKTRGDGLVSAQMGVIGLLIVLAIILVGVGGAVWYVRGLLKRVEMQYRNPLPEMQPLGRPHNPLLAIEGDRARVFEIDNPEKY